MTCRRASLVALVFATGLLGAPLVPVQAEDLSARTSRTELRRRFSNGPRRVPIPRGASARRARDLGLGEGARRSLLRGRPEPAWVDAAPEGEADLIWPVEDGWFGRGFGYVRQTRPELRHNGVDIVAPEWAVVRAANDGIVAYSDNTIRGFGNCVILVHSNGWVSIYAHLSRATVQPGWRTRRGERIGFVGQTGIARGPHLHFEVRGEGRVLDPLPLFREDVPRRRDVDAIATPFEWGDAPLRPDRGGGAAADDEERSAAPPNAASNHLDTDDHNAHDPSQAPTAIAGRVLGTAAAARYATHQPLPDEITEAAGRRFSNLLWPVRGTADLREEDHAVELDAPHGSALRAPADGFVLFAGRRGGAPVVLLAHANGWVTELRHVEAIAVAPGDRVLRGNWLGEAGTAAVGLRVYDSGQPMSPTSLLVGRPD